MQDYETNAASAAEDTGLSFDLGYQPFMQISDDGARSRAMKEIINGQKDLTAMPFKVNMPFNPAYDLMDVLKFYENQATMTDVAPITAITFRIGDKMDISCGGENPALQEAKSKETKALESASGRSYNNDFWMVTDEAPEENQVIVPADTATKIGEALFYAKEALSMFQVAYTATYNLFKTTMVEVEVFVDETSVYKTQENQWPGENRVTVTTGCEVQGVGSHKVEIYVTVTESTLDVGGGGVLTELNMTSNGIRIAADDGVYGYSKVTALIEDGMGYYAGIVDVTPQTELRVFETELDFSEMIFESDILVHEYMGPQQVSDYDGEYVTISGSRGIELIPYDYLYSGSDGVIDDGYLNICEVPSDSFTKIYVIDACDTPAANLLTAAQLDFNHWTPAPMTWTHQNTFKNGVNSLYQINASGWEDYYTEVAVEPDTDYIVTVLYNCPNGYSSYNNEGRRVYVWNQSWTYSNASPSLSDARLLGYSAKFPNTASDTPTQFSVQFNSGSNTKVYLEFNFGDVYDGSSATMLFQKICIREVEES